VTTAPVVPEHRKAWSIYADELPDFGDRNGVPSVQPDTCHRVRTPPDIPAIHVALDRGSKIHLALPTTTSAIFTSVHRDELMNYLATWRQRRRPSDEWLRIESPLYATLADVNFIAKPDRLFRRDGKIWLVDVKTKSAVGRKASDRERLQHALQLAGQRICVGQRLGLEVDVAAALYIWPDRCETISYNHPRYMDDFGALVARWADEQRTTALAAVGQG
jgi:hypothetical protein